MTKHMIEDHVQPVPSELWEWGIRSYGRPRQETLEIIRLNLLHRADASVTRYGICFRVKGVNLHNRLRYTCESAMREQWFIRAGMEGTWKVPVAYDPRKPLVIYILLDAGKRMEVCEMLPVSKTFSGSNLEEIMDHFVEQNFAQQDAQPNQTQAKACLNAYLDKQKTDVTEKTEKACQGKSKQSLLKGIKNNRKAEKDYEKDKNARDLRPEKPADQLETALPIQANNQYQDTEEGYIPAPEETEMLNEVIKAMWRND